MYPSTQMHLHAHIHPYILGQALIQLYIQKYVHTFAHIHACILTHTTLIHMNANLGKESTTQLRPPFKKKVCSGAVEWGREQPRAVALYANLDRVARVTEEEGGPQAHATLLARKVLCQ